MIRPSHKMYRALVDKVFTAPPVDTLESYIEALINELIDGFIDDSEVEFVSRLPCRYRCGSSPIEFGFPRLRMLRNFKTLERSHRRDFKPRYSPRS